MPPQSTLIGSTWLSSTDACARLRVRPQTLYAYVSRGLLHPRRVDRRSWYDTGELDALAASGRRRARSGRLEVLIDSAVTSLVPDGPIAYRGLDVANIAGVWSFERVAHWLWTGVDDGEPRPWPAPPAPPAVGESPGRRIRSAAATLAALAPEDERTLTGIADMGPLLISQLVAALPPRTEGHDADASVARRLWRRLSPLAPTPARVRALDAALVLLADHELTVSTVAARVAASAWSPPRDVVVAAMATHTGWLHGGGATSLEEQLRRGERPTHGYGHPIHPTQDPRAPLLVEWAQRASSRERWAALAPALDAGPAPANIDLVLAAFTVATKMLTGSGEAIFAIARTAGWLAHASEEYQSPCRFRPRASYIGPRP